MTGSTAPLIHLKGPGRQNTCLIIICLIFLSCAAAQAKNFMTIKQPRGYFMTCVPGKMTPPSNNRDGGDWMAFPAISEETSARNETELIEAPVDRAHSPPLN